MPRNPNRKQTKRTRNPPRNRVKKTAIVVEKALEVPTSDRLVEIGQEIANRRKRNRRKEAAVVPTIQAVLPTEKADGAAKATTKTKFGIEAEKTVNGKEALARREAAGVAVKATAIRRLLDDMTTNIAEDTKKIGSIEEVVQNRRWYLKFLARRQKCRRNTGRVGP